MQSSHLADSEIIWALWREIHYLEIFWEQHQSYSNFALKSQTWDPNGFPGQGIWTMLSGWGCWGICAGPGMRLDDPGESLPVWDILYLRTRKSEVWDSGKLIIPLINMSWEGFTLPGIYKMVLRKNKCFSAKGQDLQYDRPQTQKHYKGLFHSITFQHEKQAYNLGGVFVFYAKNYFTQAAIHCFNDWLQKSTSSQDEHAKILQRNLAF